MASEIKEEWIKEFHNFCNEQDRIKEEKRYTIKKVEPLKCPVCGGSVKIGYDEETSYSRLRNTYGWKFMSWATCEHYHTGSDYIYSEAYSILWAKSHSSEVYPPKEVERSRDIAEANAIRKWNSKVRKFKEVHNA